MMHENTKQAIMRAHQELAALSREEFRALIGLEEDSMNNLSPAEEKFMEYQHGMTGSFYTLLFRAAEAADSSNLQKLAQGFPEEVRVVYRWKTEYGYADNLLERWEKEEGVRGGM